METHQAISLNHGEYTLSPHAVRVDLQYGLPLYGSVNIVHFAPDD
jgi:hypothetical protein